MPYPRDLGIGVDSLEEAIGGALQNVNLRGRQKGNVLALKSGFRGMKVRLHSRAMRPAKL